MAAALQPLSMHPTVKPVALVQCDPRLLSPVGFAIAHPLLAT